MPPQRRSTGFRSHSHQKPYARPPRSAGAIKCADASQFIIDRTQALGEGSFGKVFRARHKSSSKALVAKVVNKHKLTPLDIETIHFEVKILQMLRGHPNILQMECFSETPSVLTIIMEQCDGSVKGFTFPLPDLRRASQQLVSGFAFMHARSIAHFDIKPDNILMQTREDGSWVLKIADFGLSCQLNSPGSPIRCPDLYTAGTRKFMSPEMREADLANNLTPETYHVSFPADVWSLGVTILCMFSREDWSEFVTQPANSAQLSAHVIALLNNEDAVDFFHCMLKYNQRKRWTMAQLAQHPFLLR